MEPTVGFATAIYVGLIDLYMGVTGYVFLSYFLTFATIIGLILVLMYGFKGAWLVLKLMWQGIRVWWYQMTQMVSSRTATAQAARTAAPVI